MRSFEYDYDCDNDGAVLDTRGKGAGLERSDDPHCVALDDGGRAGYLWLMKPRVYIETTIPSFYRYRDRQDVQAGVAACAGVVRSAP